MYILYNHTYIVYSYIIYIYVYIISYLDIYIYILYYNGAFLIGQNLISYVIFSKKNLSNKGNEMVTKCRHESKFYLANYNDIPP